MSADVLREAARLMRDEWSPKPAATFCQCEDTDAWFDRSICPEPCDSMHNICVECGLIQGHCSVAVMARENGNRLALTWLAVADLLDRECADQDKRRADLRSAFGEAGDDFMPACDPLLLALAQTYLGGDSR